MAGRGWYGQSARHSLAARGCKTRRSVPTKSARYGTRPTTVAKWLEKWMEKYRLAHIEDEKKMAKEYGWEYEPSSLWTEGSFAYKVETGKDERAGDYVEMRTDSFAYDLFYNPSTSDVPSMGYRASQKLHDDLEKQFPGAYFEHMGGGVLRIYMWNLKPWKKGMAEEMEEAEGEVEYIQNMERRISKYETDYTGEYTRGH